MLLDRIFVSHTTFLADFQILFLAHTLFYLTGLRTLLSSPGLPEFRAQAKSNRWLGAALL